jgi:hypothetical protein
MDVRYAGSGGIGWHSLTTPTADEDSGDRADDAQHRGDNSRMAEHKAEAESPRPARVKRPESRGHRRWMSSRRVQCSSLFGVKLSRALP